MLTGKNVSTTNRSAASRAVVWVRNLEQNLAAWKMLKDRSLAACL
jgi:hypothetical protein